MRRDGDVTALNQEADDPADTEQQHGGQQRGAQRALVWRGARSRQQSQQHGEAERQGCKTAAVAHQPGEQLDVPGRSQFVGIINERCGEHRHQAEREQQQCDARRDARRGAAGARQPQPRHQHQQRVGELQHMPAAPEQQFVVGLAAEKIRHQQQRPGEGDQRECRRYRRRVETETQRTRPRHPHTDRRNRRHGAQHQQRAAGGKRQQAGKKQRVLQYRNVVAHECIAGTQERRQRHHQRAACRQRKPRPAERQRASRRVETPQHAAEGEEPHQHRQVDVHHQRGMEKIRPRNQRLHPGRARQHQQHGENTGTEQRQQSEQQPADRETAAGVVRQRQQKNVGGGAIDGMHAG